MVINAILPVVNLLLFEFYKKKNYLTVILHFDKVYQRKRFRLRGDKYIWRN